MPEQKERRLVGPVQIVDQYDERARVAGAFEKCGDALEEKPALLLGWHLERLGHVGKPPTEVWQQPPHLWRRLSQRLPKLGVEKLLDCGRTSVEVRMPFGSAFTTRGTGGTGAGTRPFGVEADSLGNMNILLKRLLYADSERAWSAGVGFELPTGSSAVVTYADTTTVLDPEAVHIVPFLAWTRRNDCWFGHMFVQLDIQSHGDPLRTTLATAGVLVPAGRINQPLLFGADLGIGYWLVPPCECDSGLALVAEAHYSSPLSGQDRFTSTGPLVTLSTNTPVGASYEVIHLTTGLQWSMGNGWTLRSAVVLPGDTERVFDTEYLLQINRTF